MKYFDKIRYNRVLRISFILIPFVLGYVGYYFYFHCCKEVGSLTSELLAALYSTVRLFGFSFDADVEKLAKLPENIRIMLEIARFWAPVCTGFALFTVLKPYFLDLITAIRVHKKNSVVLHGSPSITSDIKSDLKNKKSPRYTVIEQNDSQERFKGDKHVIAFENDEDAFQFLRDHYEWLSKYSSKSKIYLCINSPDYKLANDAHVQVSCMAENCARMFWKDYYIKRFSEGCAQNEKTKDPQRIKIVIIGFDTYGQALLNQALLVNVFPQDTPGIEYHIFGESSEYLNKYPLLSRIVSFDENSPNTTDYIRFYEKNDYTALRKLCKKTESERVIICTDNDSENYRIFTKLCKLTSNLSNVYIRAKNEQITNSLYNHVDPAPGDFLYNVELEVFGKNTDLYAEDVIFNHSLENAARGIHNWYMMGSKKVNTDSWNKIGTFKQYSNFAAADHAPVKIRQVLKKDCYSKEVRNSVYRVALSFERGTNDKSDMDKLLEMEHVRWCRFHYLYGWNYADERNDTERRHNCLTEYQKLDNTVKGNDLNEYIAIYKDSVINYKTSVNYDCSDVLPEKATVHWIINGADKGTGTSYTVSNAKNNFSVRIKVTDDDNNEKSIRIDDVTVKDSFSIKLGVFFGKVFKNKEKNEQKQVYVNYLDE